MGVIILSLGAMVLMYLVTCVLCKNCSPGTRYGLIVVITVVILGVVSSAPDSTRNLVNSLGGFIGGRNDGPQSIGSNPQYYQSQPQSYGNQQPVQNQQQGGYYGYQQQQPPPVQYQQPKCYQTGPNRVECFY